MDAVITESDAMDALVRLFERGRVFVLTGAGISTESGIPDYRGPETQKRARNPIQYREFMGSERARRRYWARSMLGFPKIASAKPNQGHLALTRLEHAGYLPGIVTQNVDGLHHAAGTRSVIELHGALREVICTGCGATFSRADVQCELERINAGFCAEISELAPDGDAELADGVLEDFRVVSCERCDGTLKPHVVFFGENVPRERVERAFAMMDDVRAAVVIGSSLTVFSGFRFVLHARKLGIPVAIVTLGPTRGDGHASVRVDASAGACLRALCDRLCR